MISPMKGSTLWEGKAASRRWIRVFRRCQQNAPKLTFLLKIHTTEVDGDWTLTKQLQNPNGDVST